MQGQWGWIVVLAACGEREPTRDESPGTWVVSDDTPVAFEAIASQGNVPHAVLVRSLNALGATVGTDRIDASVNGVEQGLAADAHGYATALWDAPGTVLVEADDTRAVVHVFDTTWVGVDLHPVQEALVDDAVAVAPWGAGMLVRTESQLWWNGEGPHVVLDTGSTAIQGHVLEDFDGDGTDDVLAWTDDRVHVLRGRPGGGASYVGHLEAAGFSVGGVGAGDVNADAAPDVAVAWHASGETLVDFWLTVSPFVFVPAEPLRTRGRATSVAVSDAAGSGVGQVTVLLDDGTWLRTEILDGHGFVPVGPDITSGVRVDEGVRILRAGDMNGDLADELPLVPPFGATGRALLLDAATDVGPCAAGLPGAQCGLAGVEIDVSVATEFDVADVNVDGLDDLVALAEDGTLSSLSVAADSEGELDPSTFRRTTLMGVPFVGPMSVRSLGPDVPPTLTVAGGPAWFGWQGDLESDDGRDAWTPRRVGETVSGLANVFFAMAFDSGADDAEQGLVAAVDTGENGFVRIGLVDPEGAFRRLGSMPLDATIDDAVSCGSDVWLAIGGAAHRVVADGVAEVAQDDSLGSGVRRVDCARGVDGSAVALLLDDSVALYDADGALLREEKMEGAQDVAVGFVEGEPVVAVCDELACAIDFWRLAPGAAFGFLTTTGDVATFESEILGVSEFPLDSEASLMDVDGNGWDDLVIVDNDAGIVVLFRATGQSVAEPVAFHLNTPAMPVGRWGDVDGDGLAEFWWIDGGELRFARSLSSAVDTDEPTAEGSDETG